MSVLDVTSNAQLDDIVREAGSSKVVIVDFTATWCGPCKMMSPHVHSLASKHPRKAVFVKVDVDHAKEVAVKYQVKSMPTFYFFHKGQVVEQFSGAQPEKLNEIVERLVKACNPFSGHGFTLGGSSAAPEDSSSSGRRNPWADPNFVPPYMRNQLAKSAENEQKEQKVSTRPSNRPVTPWTNPDFKPAQPLTKSPPRTASKPTTSSKAAAAAEVDELPAANALSLQVTSASDAKPAPTSESSAVNDPALTKNVDQALLNSLVDMGFTKLRAEKALILSKSTNLEDATNWLIEHSEDKDIDEPLSIVAPDPRSLPFGAPLGLKHGEEYEDDDGLGDAMRSLRNQAAKEKKKVREMAGATKPMSDMTKVEKLEHLEKLKKARKAQKEVENAALKKEREEARRRTAKEAIDAKKKREEEQLKLAANRAKRERREEKERRNRIKEKIKRDKEERARERALREQAKTNEE